MKEFIPDEDDWPSILNEDEILSILGEIRKELPLTFSGRDTAYLAEPDSLDDSSLKTIDNWDSVSVILLSWLSEGFFLTFLLRTIVALLLLSSLDLSSLDPKRELLDIMWFCRFPGWWLWWWLVYRSSWLQNLLFLCPT
jgi:hypothetical protein